MEENWFGEKNKEEIPERHSGVDTKYIELNTLLKAKSCLILLLTP